MSRSILKAGDPSRRPVSIPANERTEDDQGDMTMNLWQPLDNQPFMDNFAEEMQRMEKDLAKLQHHSLRPFPHPLQPPPLLAPPPMSMPMVPFSIPNGDSRLDIPDFDMPLAHPLTTDIMLPMDGTIMATNGLGSNFLSAMPLAPPGPSPIITDTKHGYRVMTLELDVGGFQPEDVHVKTEGTVLQVHARRLCVNRSVGNDGMSDAKSARELRRQFTLPDVIRAENLQCSVSPDGILTVDGALGSQIIRRKKKKVKFAPRQE